MAAQYSERLGHVFKLVQRLFHMLVCFMSQKVDEKKVFPVSLFGRTAFNHGKRNAFFLEWEQTVIKGADPVADGEAD